MKRLDTWNSDTVSFLHSLLRSPLTLERFFDEPDVVAANFDCQIAPELHSQLVALRELIASEHAPHCDEDVEIADFFHRVVTESDHLDDWVLDPETA